MPTYRIVIIVQWIFRFCSHSEKERDSFCSVPDPQILHVLCMEMACTSCCYAFVQTKVLRCI